MKVVLFDAMNLIHRARSGFTKGDHALTYNFFRSFKPLVENLDPDIAYFVLEGKPAHRSTAYEGYKSNRKTQPSSFWKQQAEILHILKSLPVIQIRHPNYECDDVIANLAKHHASAGNEVVIVSSDSDFIQLFDHIDNSMISIYHPIKKTFVEKPGYVYLDWKSLRGDVSDNIPGIKGVGDKTATKIINNPKLMKEVLSDPDKKKIFDRNKSLISFHWFEDYKDELADAGVEAVLPIPNLCHVKDTFVDMGFKTMIKEKYWNKFSKAFDNLLEFQNQ